MFVHVMADAEPMKAAAAAATVDRIMMGFEDGDYTPVAL